MTVAVVVVVSATTVLGDGGKKKKNRQVTSVTYHGFYVGRFPSLGKNQKTNTNKRCKKQSTKSKYAMLFEDSTMSSLVMNQKEKKQVSLYKVVSHLNPGLNRTSSPSAPIKCRPDEGV